MASRMDDIWAQGPADATHYAAHLDTFYRVTGGQCCFLWDKQPQSWHQSSFTSAYVTSKPNEFLARHKERRNVRRTKR